MSKLRGLKTRLRPTRLGSCAGRGRIVSSNRVALALLSLVALLYGQLVFAGAVSQQAPDTLVVEQIDAEEQQLNDEGKNASVLGVATDSFAISFERSEFPRFEVPIGFPLERLLCLGSRGPPKM